MQMQAYSSSDKMMNKTIIAPNITNSVDVTPKKYPIVPKVNQSVRQMFEYGKKFWPTYRSRQE